MLRSLDPDKGFESPKSKKFEPTDTEKKKFSVGELDYIKVAGKRNDELVLRRAVAAQAVATARKNLGLSA